jgi:hypothetical protein
MTLLRKILLFLDPPQKSWDPEYWNRISRKGVDNRPQFIYGELVGPAKEKV